MRVFRQQRSFRLPRILLVTLLLALTTSRSYLCQGFTTPFSRSLQPALSGSIGKEPPSRSHRLPGLRLKSDGLTSEERDVKVQKATKAMTAFTNTYLKNTNTKLCDQKSIPAVVIKGLAEHKVDLGAPLCPCRFYEDKEAEVKKGYWNCPCVPMREEKVCHCMLFLTEDNAFAGESQVRLVSYQNDLYTSALHRLCATQAR